MTALIKINPSLKSSGDTQCPKIECYHKLSQIGIYCHTTSFDSNLCTSAIGIYAVSVAR